MSTKVTKKSKVLINNESLSEEDNEDIEDSDPFDTDLDDINAEEGFSGNEAEGEEGLNASGSGLKATNTGWADAINKVLSVKSLKSKKSSFILSKAKKDKDLKRKIDEKDSNVLEIVKSDGTVVKSVDNTTESTDKKKVRPKLSKNQWEVMCKLKPKPEDKEREQMLCSIATKGVVQLFNAVKEQQKTIENKLKETGLSETKRDKALNAFNKNQFLDKLKQKNISNKDNKTDERKDDKKQSEEQKWKVLRDDFMIGAKMKDWDKQSDSEEEFND